MNRQTNQGLNTEQVNTIWQPTNDRTEVEIGQAKTRAHGEQQTVLVLC